MSFLFLPFFLGCILENLRYFRRDLLLITTLVILGSGLIYSYLDLTPKSKLLGELIVSTGVFFVLYFFTRKWGSNLWNMRGLKPMASGNFLGALPYFDRSLNEDPNNLIAWNNKGIALANLNRYKEALESINNGLKSNFDEERTYYDRNGKSRDGKEIIARALASKGNFLSKLGKYEEALICYDKALQKYPTMSVTLIYKVDTLQEIGKYDEASKYLNKALKLNQKDWKALNNFGTILSGLEKPEEAMKCYDEALILKPNSAIALSNKGDAFLKLGKYEEALKYVDKSLKIDPKLSSAWLTKGEILIDMDKGEEALNYINKALKLNPKLEPAKKAKQYLLCSSNSYGERTK